MSTTQSLISENADAKIAEPGAKPLAVGPVRLAVAVAVLAAFWAFSVGAESVEMSMLFRFLSRMLADVVLLVFFLAWWFTNGRMSWRRRGLDFGVATLGFLVVGLLTDKSVGLFGLLLSGMSVVLTAGTVWLILCKWIPAAMQRRGLWVVVWLAWATFLAFRWDGLDGSQRSQLSWRWSPTAEQLFLAERNHAGTNANVGDAAKDSEATAKPIAFQPGDWPQFRGPDGNGQVHGVKIATDWSNHPPKELWRHRVGPAWSSMTLVDGRLFTQEQQGDKEAIACYDAASGKELWAHLDEGRFAETLSGAGPRETPTFADGRIYTLGGFGQADCLDAATGRLVWSHLLYAPSAKTGSAAQAVTDAAVPQWGVANSPLVIGDTAMFFTGAQPDHGLLAFNATTGKALWNAATGKNSYASPQKVFVENHAQVLMSTNSALTAIEPSEGRTLWQYAVNGGDLFSPILQPQAIGEGRFVIHTPNGLTLIQATKQDSKWTTKRLWESSKLKPTLNDFVVQDSALYGFDDGIFCCLDLATGKRRWKAGRYGHGQVLLLTDQNLLLVMGEFGEAVLLRANPERHEELARFQTISGKTWNHPVVAHGRLYVRNAEEMACYELPHAGLQVAAEK